MTAGGQQIDWPRLLIELQSHGFGVVRVAEALNLPRQTVQAWRSSGAEPRYGSGIALVRLFLAVVERSEPASGFAVPLRIAPIKRHPSEPIDGINPE